MFYKKSWEIEKQNFLSLFNQSWRESKYEFIFIEKNQNAIVAYIQRQKKNLCPLFVTITFYFELLRCFASVIKGYFYLLLTLESTALLWDDILCLRLRILPLLQIMHESCKIFYHHVVQTRNQANTFIFV